MQRLEPTRSLAFKLWWSFIWRCIVFTVGIALLVGILAGLVAGMLGISQDTAGGLVTLLTIPITFAIQIEVLFRILKKARFKNFEILLANIEEQGS